MQHYDVLIIGSGISSLTCAAILAKKGKRVGVFERYRKPGGYLHCFSRFGCEFDTGSHYVGGIDEGQPFHTLLSYLDAFDEDIFLPLDREGFDVFKFPTWEFSLPAGHKNAVDKLSEYFPSEKAGIERYFDLVQKVARAFPTYEFNEKADANSMIEMLSTSLTQVVESLTSNAQLRNFFYSYCTLHCVTPEDTPFGFHAVMTDSLLRGPYGFKKGGDALGRTLVRSIEAKGGDVHLRDGVTAFDVDNASIKAVHTHKGGTYTADWIISGIHPKATFDLVGHDHLRPAFKMRLRGIRESVPLFGIYAACSEPPPFDIDKNYYAFSSEDPNEYSEIYNPNSCLESVPKGIYISRNSRKAQPGAKGFYPLTLHAPGPYHWFKEWEESRFADRPGAYYDGKLDLATNLIEFADSVFPGMQKSIDQFESSSALSNLFYNGSHQGSAYGIYHSIDNTGVRGLGPRTHIRNLLLTGQSTLFPGLLASSIAGLRTAGHIVGVKPLLKELRLSRSH